MKDCTHLEKFSKTLNKEFQKDLQQYRIKTMSEFVRFLISKLNRTNPTTCSDTLEAQIVLTKRILQVIGVLHNREAADLAKRSTELLDGSHTVSQIETVQTTLGKFYHYI